jgi:4-hydroxy-tetrahydrodipicolinate synthase
MTPSAVDSRQTTSPARMALAADFLVGSCPPLVTPFIDGRVDLDTYADLVEFQIANGTHGLVVNGTTGEPSTLSVEERNSLVRTAVTVARGRVPVIAATGSQSYADTLALTEAATDAGADALLIVTPYFVRPPQRGLIAYYAELAARTSLPWMIYHIPGRAAVSVELSTLVAIAERAPNFVGIKHASPDFALVSAMIERFGPEFRVFVGLEEFTFPMMAVGALGTMNAVANLVPGRVAALCESVRAGDLAGARARHFGLLELCHAVFYDTNPIPLKYMMKRLGLLKRNEHRLPMAPASRELEDRLDALLATLELA